MSRLLLLLSLSAAAAFPITPLSRPDPLAAVQGSFDEGRYAEVVGGLSDESLQRLPSRELPRAYLLLGQSYWRLGQLDRAIGVLQLGVGLFPKDLPLLSNLGNVLHEVDLNDRASLMYARILDRHPNNALANLGLAEIDEAQGDLDASIRHYETCLREWKQNPGIWRAYADVLAQKRDFRAAGRAIEKSLALSPDNVDSLQFLADLQFQQGLIPDAHKTLAKASELAPERKDLPLRDSLWFLEEGNLRESMARAQEVLEKFPDDPLGVWIRASIALRRGNREEARRDLRFVASRSREAPFTSQVAASMLLQMQ